MEKVHFTLQGQEWRGRGGKNKRLKRDTDKRRTGGFRTGVVMASQS